MNEESEQVSKALQELADEAFRQVCRERDEARAEVARLKAAGADLADAACALVGHADRRNRLEPTEREQLRNALDAWDVAP